jgi:hypothetical protein
MSDIDDGADPKFARVNSLLQFEDELLECREAIDLSMKEFREEGELPTQPHLIRALKISVSGNIDEESREDIIYALLNTIMNDGHTDVLADKEASEEFIQFIVQLVQKYHRFVQAVWLRTHQGKKFWWRVDTEYVRRGETNEIGMNHSIYTNNEGELEITVSPNSNLNLIDTLLEKQNNIMNDLSDQEMKRLDRARIKKIQERVNDISEKI